MFSGEINISLIYEAKIAVIQIHCKLTPCLILFQLKMFVSIQDNYNLLLI